MSTTTTAKPANVATVETIGRATIKTGKTAALIVANVPDNYDWTARGAVPGAVHLWATGTSDKSAIPAQKKADKTPTVYGVGVDTLVHAVKRLIKAETESTVAMRVSLTGTGSAIVPEDHPAYPLLMALLTASAEA